MVIRVGDSIAADFQDPDNPGVLGPAVIGPIGRLGRVTLTAAGLVALWTTRREIIPAPGVGRFIVPGTTVIRRVGSTPLMGTTASSFLWAAWVPASGGVVRVRPRAIWFFGMRNDNDRVLSLFQPNYTAYQAPASSVFADRRLYENTPLVLVVESATGTQTDWEDALAPLTGSTVPIEVVYSGGRVVVAVADIDSNGALTTVDYTGNNFVWDAGQYSLAVVGEGTGAVVSPVLDADNRITDVTVVSAGTGYLPVDTTVTFDIRYRIWTP